MRIKVIFVAGLLHAESINPQDGMRIKVIFVAGFLHAESINPQDGMRIKEAAQDESRKQDDRRLL
jgi:hypothetical protein